MENWIDLRSDTVTHPTAEMRRAMAEAPLGDDVYGDDPSVNRLQEMAAHMLGMQAALLVASGTMGNQIALMTHTRPGDEIVISRQNHIVMYEAGAAARLSGVGYALAESFDALARPETIHSLVRPQNDVHAPHTSLLCLENARGDGAVMPLAVQRAAMAAARAQGLRVHLDGARIFNAALALGVPPAQVAQGADSVMFCLSKGLCAPVGSLLCGSEEFIAKARKNRQILGGGMRQAGVLAACGIVALETMIPRLAEDHENARLLGTLLAGIPGVRVAADCLDINMVFWHCTAPGFNDTDFLDHMHKNGILINAGGPALAYRFVTHRQAGPEAVRQAAAAVAAYVARL